MATPPMIDFEFYKGTYGGELPVEGFATSLPSAVRHVDWLCNGRIPITDSDVLRYKRAICAALDAFAEFGDGQVGGFQLGEFKMTHYEDEGTTGDEQATKVALKELYGTGLSFCGVC